MRGIQARLRAESAQSMIEVGLVLPFIVIIICGIFDFGFILNDRIALNNAARNGARYAATHPTAWSNSASSASNTIQGVILSSKGNTHLTNDDSHITIAYETSAGTACAQYSASSGSLTVDSGYTQGTNCVIPNGIVQVTLTYHYTPITPFVGKLISSGLDLTATSSMLEEQ